MASHPLYDRPPASYATRPSPVAGPPRSDLPYIDRDPHIPYPPPEAVYADESDRFIPRHTDKVPFYDSASHYYPPSRDPRADPWVRDAYYPPPLPVYTRAPTPPPLPLAPQYHDRNWVYDESREWENPPRTRAFEPSVAWRQTHGEPSNPRLNSLLNPAPPSPQADERRWRGGPEAVSPRDYGRPYHQDYYAYDYRQPAYHDGPMPYPQTDSYRQYHYDTAPQPLPRAAPAYQHPAARPARPSAMGNYKRQRQPSGQSYRPAESGSPHWNKERGMGSSKHSRDGSLSSPAPMGAHGRVVSEPSQSGNRTAPAPSTAKTIRRVGDVSESDAESSDDESDRDSSRSIASSRNLPVQINETPKAADIPISKPASSSRRFSPVRHETSARRHAGSSPITKAEDTVRPGAEPSSVRSQNSALGRQGIMSVHNLVSPTPVKGYLQTSITQRPLIPPYGEKTSDSAEIPRNIQSSPDRIPDASHDSANAAESISSPKISTLDMDVDEIRPEHSVSHLATPLRVASPNDSGLRPTPSIEPSIINQLQNLTPSTHTPDPDADRTLADIEDQVAHATLSSPKAPNLPLPHAPKTNVRKEQKSIPLPRLKPDEKLIAETLRKAIMARRNLSNQTREQRVNPILIANLTMVDPPPKRAPTSAEVVVQEVLERVFAQSKEENHMNTRSVLATNFAEQQELLAEKTQRLRDEYLQLHETWLGHCANLDSLLKANDMQETATVMGRMTRRSAATLGDAVRSDLEMEQIIASLGNEDLTDPNHLAVRNIATVPDMISVEKGHVDYSFDDTNGLVDDPETFYDPRSGFFDWTPEEETKFYAKFADYPKQFGTISSFLPHKSAAQCVLYYYIHKKKLVDFRNAANVGNAKRKKGPRKAGKQKGNGLLADIQQTDSQRPSGRGRRRRGAAPVDGGRGRGVQSSDLGADQDTRPKRRRVASAINPRIVMAKEMDFDDSLSVDTDLTRETSIAPPKKRRGRKPKVLVESRADSPTAGEARFIDVNETFGRRKSTTSSSSWTETDRDEFIRLLSRHGKNFKRIAAAMPNKTTIQVSNYYKSHLGDLQLDKVVASALARTPSPEPGGEEQFVGSHKFVEVTAGEASQSQTPTDEMHVDPVAGDQAQSTVDKQMADATSGVGVMTLDQNTHDRIWVGEEYPFSTTIPPLPPGAPSHRTLNQKSYISILHPGAFQSVGSGNPRGMIISSRGHTQLPFGPSNPPPMISTLSPQPQAVALPPPGSPPASQVHQDPHELKSQEVPPDEEWQSHPRYSSFRAQLPRTGFIATDKRIPVPIQPAPIPLPPNIRFPFYPGGPNGIHYVPNGEHYAQGPPVPNDYSGLPPHILQQAINAGHMRLQPGHGNDPNRTQSYPPFYDPLSRDS